MWGDCADEEAAKTNTYCAMKILAKMGLSAGHSKIP